MSKERLCSFGGGGKEPIIERIFRLVDRYPSRNEAAKAWGVNLNTLQNYYKRKHLNPTPRKNLLIKIAEREGVSIEWLQYGEERNERNERYANTEMKSALVERDVDGERRLFELLSLLTRDEKQALFEVLARKGVETVLYLLDEDNIELLKLDRVIKDKVLGKHYPKDGEQAALNDANSRECGFDGKKEEGEEILASYSKRAV